jgi:hypothetical protein
MHRFAVPDPVLTIAPRFELAGFVQKAPVLPALNAGLTWL